MAEPFVSREELGDKLGEDLSASEYALTCVDAASEMCRTISEQTFNRGTADAITLDGTGTDVLLLPEYPAGNVINVTEDGEDVPSTDYALNDATGGLVRVPTNGYTSSNFHLRPTVVWNRGRRNITLTYDHGYDDIPQDVRMVALAIAAKLFKQGPAVFETLGARSVRYAGEATDLSANDLRILRRYKRER